MQVKSKFLSFGKSGRRKQLRQNKVLFFALIAVLASLVVVFHSKNQVSTQKNLGSKFGQVISQPTPTPSPSPSPKPLTFAEMNTLYGPCVNLPTLMYHHVQTKEQAVVKKQTGLTVNTDTFKDQMQYLKDKGYSVVGMISLTNFFDSGTPIPGKSILLTFDDGYEDFYTDAYPILTNMGFAATLFTPTGLMDNPGYLNWDQIASMRGTILFGNHTWSHKSVVNTADMQREISTADIQLSDHGLNSPKVFAYPYGPDTLPAEDYLNKLGYEAAYTTKPGSTLCKKQRFNLPRIRIGNTSLSQYGF